MPDIPSDLAAKVLGADLRNIVKKVGDGTPLSPAERQMFLTALAGSSDFDEIRQARQVALLRKFSEGGRLKKEEMDEIQPFMPATATATGRTWVTTDAYRGHWHEYEAIYNRKRRAMGYWVEAGKKAPGGPRLPPLWSPREMLVWWGEVMSHECPEDIKNAARAAAPPPPPSSASALPQSRPQQPAPPRLPPPARPEDDAVATTEESLRRVLHQRDAAYQRLLDAQAEESRDEGKITGLKKDWQKLDAEARAAEEHALEMRQKLGRLLDEDQVSERLYPKLQNIALEVRALWRRIRQNMLAAEDESAEDALWQSALDDSFEELRRSGFARPAEPLELAA